MATSCPSAERDFIVSAGMRDSKARLRPLPRDEDAKKRGASIASSRLIPNSMMLTMIWVREGKILAPPGEPSTRNGLPFTSTISGAMELTQYMMVTLVGFGLAYCALVKGLVSVEVLTSRFSPRVQAILNSITYFLSFGFFSLVTWQSIKYIRLIFESNLVSAVLLIPTYPFVAMLALGSLVFSLVLLVHFLDYLSQVVNK